MRDLETFPSMQAVAADTASAVSMKGWKERRFTKEVASDAVEKNFLWMSSGSVLASFFSLLTLKREYPAGVSNKTIIIV